MTDLPENSVHPLSRAEWRAWLEQHHTRTTGAWLISYKKATGKPRLEYEEAVEEALCFAWVDSKSARGARPIPPPRASVIDLQLLA